MKATKTEAFTAPLDTYDRIIIMAPVWAGRPAPAIYTAFDALPAGKEALVCLVSMGGSSDCEGQLRALLQRKGCTLTGVENIKS
jgi:NAD(P)H-dependent FMN reductase